MRYQVLVAFIVMAGALYRKVQGTDRLLRDLRHLRRHAPGRASPPASVLEGRDEKPACELFIGIPSGSAKRRMAIRKTWGRGLSVSESVIMLFYVYEEEEALGERGYREEQAEHNDLVLIKDEEFEGGVLATGRDGITQRVYLMLQHAQANFDMKLLAKVDDDTYMNMPILLNAIRESVKDRSVYIGYKFKKTWWDKEEESLGDAWRDDLGEENYVQSMFPTYMQGGAWILSKEAVDGIIATNHAVGLRFLESEDVAVGLWVSGMPLKYITGDDLSLTFLPWGGEGGGEPMIKKAENYCQGAKMPLGWVHGLKEPDAMMDVFRLAQSCKDSKAGLEPT